MLRLSKNQIVLLGLAGVLGTVLFIKGFKTSTSSVVNAAASSAKQFDFDKYLLESKQELGGAARQTLSEIDETKADEDTYKKLVVLWDSTNHPLIAAHYMEKLAVAQPSEQNWFAAGSKYYMIAATSNDTLIANESVAGAKRALEKVIAINPDNLDAKNALAACYIEADEDVMKGVGMLKEVVEKDSNNVQAIYTLGMLSIRSNQFDKALERFEKLIMLQPFNPEYYYYLGEIQAKTGNATQAVKTYEKCKTLLKDEEAKKEIDKLIHQLKNI